MESRGLTSAEVAARVAEGKVNRVKPAVWREYGRIFARNLFTVFNALVIPAAIALFLLREYPGGIAVLGMVCINTIIALVQEIRAKWHLDHLTILVETRARVVRDGREQSIPAGDVVVDDLIRIANGEPVVADGTVLESNYLEVDEALLTGESDPVRKPPGERLLSGSFCVAGEGSYRAEKVGKFAFANDLAAQARAYHHHASPLQRDINHLVRLLTFTAICLVLLYLAMDWYGRGFSNRELVKMIAATITSMVPQGLVLMATLAFTLGAVRMSQRGALVQRLNAVESMAAVDVLCMDKTGTLTTNRLTLERVVAIGPDRDEAKVRRRLAEFAWASMDEQNRSILALRQSLPRVEVEALERIPFKSQNRYSAVRVKSGPPAPESGPPARELILALGASEALKPFLRDRGSDWETAWRELLQTGTRILLFAGCERPCGGGGSLAAGNLAATSGKLEPWALVSLTDELRAEADQVLRAFADQGIEFKIISGDHPETVHATVRHLPLGLAHEPVVTGEELSADADADELIEKRHIFGRVTPFQKVEIVKRLQRRRHHVAMIGDGVNDVLPIKQADLGIAMGEGTRAAKTVAALVLEKNDFGVLPETLAEGRTILRNLARAGKLFLLKNVYTLLLVLVGFALLGLPFPFVPQQVTMLNLITIGVPALLMTLERDHSAAARRTGYLREVGVFALASGAVVASAVLGVQLLAIYGFGYDADQSKPELRTLGLAVLILLGLANVVRILRLGGDRPLPTDRKYYWYVPVGLGLFVLLTYVPPTAWFFELASMGVWEWLLVLVFTSGALAALRFVLPSKVGEFKPLDVEGTALTDSGGPGSPHG